MCGIADPSTVLPPRPTTSSPRSSDTSNCPSSDSSIRHHLSRSSAAHSSVKQVEESGPQEEYALFSVPSGTRAPLYATVTVDHKSLTMEVDTVDHKSLTMEVDTGASLKRLMIRCSLHTHCRRVMLSSKPTLESLYP